MTFSLWVWISLTHSPCRDLAVVHVGCDDHAGFPFIALWEEVGEQKVIVAYRPMCAAFQVV